VPDVNDIIRELAGPLRVEGRTGYRDTTIIGSSIGDYARAWAGRAREAGLSEEQRARCGEISVLLADYRKMSAAARKPRVAQALRLLGEMGNGADVDRRGGQRSACPAQGDRTAGAQQCAPTGRTSRTRKAKEPDPPPSVETDLLDQPVPAGQGRSILTQRLAKLGIETNRELLYHFPREYVPLKNINDLVDGERAAVVARAITREQSVMKEGRGFALTRFALELSDDSGRAWVTSVMRIPRMGQRAAVLLNSPPALNHTPGTRLLVEGLVKRAGKFIDLQYGDVQRLLPEETFPVGQLAPVYPLTDGLYQSNLRGVVRRVLNQLPDALPDPLPQAMRERYRLTDLVTALRDIHWPLTEEAKQEATRRLALEELLTLQLAMAQRKRELQRPGSGISMKPRGDVVVALEEVLPFSLTRAQQRAIAEITADMASDQAMCRLIQGDVGSGKTVVAAGALMVALQNGYQGAVMAPTELLAEQHYLVLSHLLKHFGVTVELLTGSLKASEREQAYRRLASGRAQVAVGTQALIQEGVAFHRLGLVIVDEQHRFGVKQRAELRTKGQQPDMLVMTATPIPRTLALTVYGDLEVSILDEMPPGRTPVQTRWIPVQRQAEAYDFVRRQIAEGRQAYVVCPLVEESEHLQAEAAVKLAEELQKGEFSDLRVGLLHGAMKVAEKDAVMEAFRAGEADVLVATTVIEVGVDVTNAGVMLILNAERFGLAQLHQLRGRVGRGPFTSHCLLLTHQKYDPTGRIKLGGEEESREDARRRLKVLIEQSDGFVIAEEDLLLRGPGEFYGTRQHGLPDFRLARMVRDVKLVEEAREIAFWVTEQDPELRRPEHAVLRGRVEEVRARMDRIAG